MARPRQKECPNCKGTNEKCKYLITGRKCVKGLAKGKAIGKAKGKAVSKATIEKREKNDELLGDLRTDYLNEMRVAQIYTLIDDETGEIFSKESMAKVYSFERWLSINGHKTLATWLRRHYKNLEQFNFKDFTETENMENEQFLEIKVLGNKEIIKKMLSICIRNGQEFMDNYTIKIEEMVKDYESRGMNVNKYKEQLEIFQSLKTVENAKEFLEENK